MKFLKKLFFSKLGYFYCLLTNAIGFFRSPFMIYGYWNFSDRRFKKNTRFSSTAYFINRKSIDIADNCWIWHYTIIDGSNTVTIKEGAQIGAWVGIFTHSSHIAIRLHGKDYINIPRDERIGYVRAPVVIGEYAFVGAGSYILPGVVVGKGALISAGSVVKYDVPDFAIVSGNPAKVIGSVNSLDSRFLKSTDILKSYIGPKDCA